MAAAVVLVHTLLDSNAAADTCRLKAVVVLDNYQVMYAAEEDPSIVVNNY